MTQSLEDYLETIYLLTLSKKVARVKDISELLEVKKPSVINAIKELTGRNYISHEKYGYIELTEQGILEASKILEKHNLIKKFLVEVLKVDEKTAEKDACSMEHFLSKETLSKIEIYTKNGGSHEPQ